MLPANAVASGCLRCFETIPRFPGGAKRSCLPGCYLDGLLWHQHQNLLVGNGGVQSSNLLAQRRMAVRLCVPQAEL